jgi:hypothetical protein
VDRMVIVGTDGKDKFVIEGEEIVDVTIVCETFLKDGYHQMTWLNGPICGYCGQSEHELRIKGEKVVN